MKLTTRFFTDKEQEAFQKELDEIREARVWLNSNGYSDCAVPYFPPIFKGELPDDDV